MFRILTRSLPKEVSKGLGVSSLVARTSPVAASKFSTSSTLKTEQDGKHVIFNLTFKGNSLDLEGI